MLMQTESASPASSAWMAARPPPSICPSSTFRPYLRSSPSSGTIQTRMFEPATAPHIWRMIVGWLLGLAAGAWLAPLADGWLPPAAPAGALGEGLGLEAQAPSNRLSATRSPAKRGARGPTGDHILPPPAWVRAGCVSDRAACALHPSRHRGGRAGRQSAAPGRAGGRPGA